MNTFKPNILNHHERALFQPLADKIDKPHFNFACYTDPINARFNSEMAEKTAQEGQGSDFTFHENAIKNHLNQAPLIHHALNEKGKFIEACGRNPNTPMFFVSTNRRKEKMARKKDESNGHPDAGRGFLTAADGRPSNKNPKLTADFDSCVADHPLLTDAGRYAIKYLPNSYKCRLNQLFKKTSDPVRLSELLTQCANHSYLVAIGRNAVSRAKLQDLMENWSRHQETLHFLQENGILHEVSWIQQHHGIPTLERAKKFKEDCSDEGVVNFPLLRYVARKFFEKGLPSKSEIDKLRSSKA